MQLELPPKEKGILPHVTRITSQVHNIICGIILELCVGLSKVMLSILCLSITCEYLVIYLDMVELFSVCPLGVIREYLSRCIIITHGYFHILFPITTLHIHPQRGFSCHITLGYTISPLSRWWSKIFYLRNNPH